MIKLLNGEKTFLCLNTVDGNTYIHMYVHNSIKDFSLIPFLRYTTVLVIFVFINAILELLKHQIYSRKLKYNIWQIFSGHQQ